MAQSYAAAQCRVRVPPPAGHSENHSPENRPCFLSSTTWVSRLWRELPSSYALWHAGTRCQKLSKLQSKEVATILQDLGWTVEHYLVIYWYTYNIDIYICIYCVCSLCNTSNNEGSLGFSIWFFQSWQNSRDNIRPAITIWLSAFFTRALHPPWIQIVEVSEGKGIGLLDLILVAVESSTVTSSCVCICI